ncbi:MAG: hypothetical protein NTW86_13790, partial [Candidatus Sumerlaeota bacterium]|nr:hypothetical protein [Candidatus Sumerlaeota bacterium]
MDDQGRFDTIYSLPPNELKAGLLCQEPRPIVPRKREPVIPARVDPDETTGRVILADVRYGRNMEGVAPGEIKKLLVLETLPMPAHYQGGMRPITAGGSFTLERVLGTIPVEPDGSAYAELPAMRSLFFVALDENDLSLKRMQSFMTLQPGETLGCTGCHESRTLAPARLSETTLQALRRAPSAIEPVEGAPDVIDFPRDVQPILDRHCVSCHDWNRREGRVTLSGDRGPIYSHSYFTLTTRGYVVDGRNKPRGNRPPRTIGSGASPLMKFIDGSHYGATLSKAERDTIRLWIDSGAAYPGTYAALGTGSMADTYFLPKYDWTASPVKVTGGYEGFRADAELASGPDALKVIQTRCGRCHKGDTRVPARPSDLMEGKPLTAHLVVDLTVPERSLILTAPLAKQAGGLAERPATAASELVGKGKGCVAVFAGADDPGYQALLTEIRDCKGILDRMKRFDLPGFRPREEYIREMKRYGFLPETLGPGDPIDVYATERKYWESFWLKPPAQTASAEKAGTAEH